MFIMWPYIGNLVWGSRVESNEKTRKLMGFKK
jgi:hypothetical protein